LADNHFAAQLDQVVRDPIDYPIYGDPEEFFSLTHPTKGLQDLLTLTFGRLSGAKVPNAERGVIRIETSFGGGKTHSLIAVYHLAKGARPSNVDKFIDPALLPSDCQVAAVVGDTLDPANGLTTNGIQTFTIWGELAAQLGPQAFEAIRRSEEMRTAPGKDAWTKAFGGKPTIIIIDELAQHLRQLSSSGSAEIRGMADAVPAFLKNLFEVAAGSRNVVVLLTLATRADAFGKETDQITDLLSEVEQQFSGALSDTKSILARTGFAIKPAEDAEIGQILKTRLFESIDSKVARTQPSRLSRP